MKKNLSIEIYIKRFLYKKYFLKKDINMALRNNSLDRVLRIVPKHSKEIFLKEIKKYHIQ